MAAEKIATASLESLRRHAVAQSLFPPVTLAAAIERLGFVQADPIRAPARAQDLILRHRVARYRAGDLEREYASLDIEEDVLYAYGFVSRHVWNLLHPRKHAKPSAFERKVLETVQRLGEAHPAALEAHLGRRRVINAWGGYSKATTSALEDLHYRGLVRIARRENGIRIYKPSTPPSHGVPPQERLRLLALLSGRIFAPSPERSLQATINRYRRIASPGGSVAALVKSGALRREVVDGVAYVWPEDQRSPEPEPRVVRFLAPFDPLVWDRSRFEHLWGWTYRFEAYTPVKKRVRGYYALPLLWGDRVVGWANVKPGATGATGAVGATGATGARATTAIEFGYVNGRPKGRDFTRELDAEVARLTAFLS